MYLVHSLKIKFVFFNGTPPHFVHFGNKIIPAKYEKNSKKFRGCYRAMNFCTQSQWDLWAIFLTTQKSCVDFSRLCQKLVIIV